MSENTIRLSPSGPIRAVDAGLTGYTSRGTGAVFRSFDERSQNEVWVTDFMTDEEQADCFDCTLLFDLQPAVQAAINYALYRDGVGISGGPRVRVPAGLLRLDSPVQVGYGIDFRSLIFEGEGIRYGGGDGSAGSGTSFVCTFDDAPGIVVQGGRSVTIQGFSIFGLNLNYVGSIIANPQQSDLIVGNWVDPTLPASASSRYAPYAGIAIDPYSGAQPGVHYPDVEYPEFLGAVAQYNKEFSSATTIKDVYIFGFVVGVAQQPCDADGNGDFTHFDNVSITFCAYGVSWGNSQSRVISFDKCNFTNMHTVFSTTVYGRRIGQPQMSCIHSSYGSVIALFNIPNLGFGQGPMLQHCFAEGIYSIGLLGAAAADSGNTLFEDVELGFGWWELYGVPTYTLDNGGGIAIHSFKNVTFYLSGFIHGDIGVWGGLAFRGINFDLQSSRCYSFEGCSAVFASEPTQLWQKCALNATGGMVVSFNGSRLFNAYSWRHSHVYDLDTGADLGSKIYNQSNTGLRNSCLPAYSTSALGLIFGQDPGVPAYFRYGEVVANGAGGVVTQSGRNITFTFTSASSDYLQNFGGDVGDVIICRVTGAVFWVYARTATVISARAMTGFNGAGNLLTAVPDGADFATINCRHYMIGSNAVLYGDFTAGSPVITNVARADYAPPANIADNITVGDWLYVDSDVDQFLVDPFGGNRVASIDNAAHTITLAGNASATVAIKHQRLGIFTRTAMPNGTPTP